MAEAEIDKRWPERRRRLTPDMAKNFYMLCSGKIIAKTLVHNAKFDVLMTLNNEYQAAGGICVAWGHCHN